MVSRSRSAVRLRRVLLVLVPLIVMLLIAAACSTSQSDLAGGGTTGLNPTGTACGTPNQGCPCDTPGDVVECGSVEQKSGDYVSCSMGTRTCVGGTWGACNGTNIVQSKVAAGTTIHGAALGAGVVCPLPPDPIANPCDPYCNNFVDNPIGLDAGGFTLVEGGLTIPPVVVDAGDAGVQGGGPPILTSTTGLDTCSGAMDAITNPCSSGNPNKNCQQDFHCDLVSASPTYQKCVWSEPSYYVDSTCNGVDLTVGTGCDAPTGYLLPVCNHGTKTLSAGANIKIALTNAAGYNTWNSSCTSGAPVSCNFTIASPLGPGQCVTTNACPAGAGQGYAIVNADNSIPECASPGAACLNNGAAIKNGGAGCATCACNSGTAEVTGTILDPAKLRPVFGATLYVPSSPVNAFAPNVACDTCANIYSGLPALASTTTDVDGKFRLQGVPAGVAFPVVLELGRFRRQFMMGPISACTSAALGAAQSHLPATQTKVGDTAGDTANPELPKIAMVTGNGDATECLLARMGFATSEFTGPAGAGAIHMYTYAKTSGLTGTTTGYGAGYGAGSTLPANASGAADVLLGTSALNNYNALIMPCGNQAPGQGPSPGMQSNVQTWMNNGGRLFASHIAVEDFIHKPIGNPNDAVATWAEGDQWGSNPPDSSDRAPAFTLNDNVNQSFPYGAAMARWIPLAWPAPGGPGGTVPPTGVLPALPNYRNNVKAVTAPTTSWFSGTSNYTGAGAGLQHNMISFDTPVGAAPAAQCGRAVLPFMHVSSTSSGTFPTNCGTVPNALTGQELAFEYMMWQSMTCLSPSTVPPTAPPPTPPGPPSPLSPVTFTRDYLAICPSGTRVKWQYFYWQALVLGGSIQFRAATADAEGGTLPPSPPAGAPTTVAIGTASSTVLSPTWGQDARTVSDHLYNDPTPGAGVQSKEQLRIYMTFNPAGAIAPVLYAWRQTYDCVPAE